MQKLKLFLTSIFILLNCQLFAQTHFTKVWSGTPYQAMNIFLLTATYGGTQLSSGDEIAVFDGSNCVGVVTLSGPVSNIEIKASTDDPATTSTTDGFIGGHTITYKLWLAGTSQEIDNYSVTYNPVSPVPTFTSLATAFVNLTYIVTDVEQLNNILPKDFSLFQNYPNPFNPSTTIKFALPFESNVKLQIVNALGQEIKVLTDNKLSAGNYKINFNAKGLASGVYFYRLVAGSFIETKRMVLLK